MKKVEDYIKKYFPVDTFATFMVQAEIIDEANLFVGDNYVEYHEDNIQIREMMSMLDSLGAYDCYDITATDELDIYEKLVEEGINAVLVGDLISTEPNCADVIYDYFVYSYMAEGAIRITFKESE